MDSEKLLDDKIKRKEYCEAFVTFENIIRNKNNNEIIDIIKRKELLINPDCDAKKKSMLIIKVKKVIRVKGIDLNDYVMVCDLVNSLYKDILKFEQKYFEDLHKYNRTMVEVCLFSQLENYSEDITGELKNITKDEIYYDRLKNVDDKYTICMSGFNILMKRLMQDTNFRTTFAYKDKDDYTRSLNRCNKKVIRKKILVEYLVSLQNICDLRNIIKNHDFSVKICGDEVHIEYKDYKSYAGYRINSIRHMMKTLNDTFDIDRSEQERKNEFINNNKNIFDNVDMSKLITIKSDGTYLINFIPWSNEYIKNITDRFMEYRTEFLRMTHNNFVVGGLDKEIIISNNKIKNGKKKLNITYNEAIEFYFVVKVIAYNYLYANNYFYKEIKDNPLISVCYLDLGKFKELLKLVYNTLRKSEITDRKINELIKFYTFGEDEVYDFFYKPLYVKDNNICVLPAIFEKNNFCETFPNHLNRINAPFKDSNLHEGYFKNIFRKNGFNIYLREKPDLNFDLGHGIKGDIDILMVKGKYIFAAQLKNRSNPMDEKDYTSLSRKVNRACTQLKYAEAFLHTNPEYILEELNIKDTNDYIYVPFIITNSFYESGKQINGVYITDSSAIGRYFNDKDVSIRLNNEIIYSKNIFTNPCEDGFVELLQKPYFLDHNLYYNLYARTLLEICDKYFIAKVPDDIADKHMKNCYYTKFLNSNN